MTFDITRTELVWPGKYDEDGKRREPERPKLPFQVIERVNESRATRTERQTKGMTLFDYFEPDTAETFETGWRNKLIWGDNLLVMSSLLDQFAGKVDLIYIDPHSPRERTSQLPWKSASRGKRFTRTNPVLRKMLIVTRGVQG